MEQVVDIRKKVYREVHPDVATALSNLAQLLNSHSSQSYLAGDS